MEKELCFVVASTLNEDMGFAVTVKESEYEEAKELASAGFFAWLGDEDRRKKYFPDLEPDDDYWYCTGYGNAAADLMAQANIDFMMEPCFDLEGNFRDDFDDTKVKELIGN